MRITARVYVYFTICTLLRVRRVASLVALGRFARILDRPPAHGSEWNDNRMLQELHEKIQMGTPVRLPNTIVWQVWVHGCELIGSVHIEIIVDPPVHVSDTTCRVEQPLQHIREDNVHPKGHSATFNSPEHGFDHMRRLLKDIGPHMIKQVQHSILAAETLDTQSDVFGNRRRGLPMHEITVLKGIRNQGRDCVDVVLGCMVG